MKTNSFQSLALSGLYAVACSSAFGEYVVSPLFPTPNSESVGAFLATQAQAPSVRFQQVHAAGDFISASGPVLLINELSYSAPSWSGRVPIDATLPSIEIRLSTTLKNPDGLSANFAENVGADQTVVYSGPLHFFETELETYDIHVPIASFRYDPSLGNLLVEVFNYAPLLSRRDPDWRIQTANQLFDSVSGLGGRVTDSVGTLGTGGLVTRFTYTPVPEPSTWALLVTGVVVFGVFGWRRRLLGRKQDR